MVLAAAIEPLARQPIRGYDLPAGALLDNAIAVALAVEQFAMKLHVSAPPHAFTAGLLHDVGKIVMGTFLEVDAARHPAAGIRGRPVLRGIAEQRVLRRRPRRSGSRAARCLERPQGRQRDRPVASPARRHPHEDTRGVDLVHVADIAGRLGGFGVGADGLNYAPSMRVLRRLRITTEITEEVVSQVLIDMKQLESILVRTPGG